MSNDPIDTVLVSTFAVIGAALLLVSDSDAGVLWLLMGVALTNLYYCLLILRYKKG